ncbi:MAG: DUF805 domain-containing protein [Alphaproteobacteria bacterium]|nr:DUF805 domain-containing protein [Alphaproteobacteria bacterium]
MGYWVSYLFSASGRFRRLDWILVNISILCLNGSLGLLYLRPDISLGALAVLYWIVYIVGLVAGVASTIKRFHDHGKSGWNCLYLYLPVPALVVAVVLVLFHAIVAAYFWLIGYYLYFFFVLAVKPGDNRENRYGPSPYSGELNPPSVPAALAVIGALLLVAAGAGYSSYSALAAAGGMQKLLAGRLSPEDRAKLEKMMAARKAGGNSEGETPAVKPAETGPSPAEIAAREAEEKKRHEELRQKAIDGDKDAQYQLAFLYAIGSKDMKKDETTAAFWLAKSAMQGDAAAQYNLGIFYRDGTGVAADNNRAYFWLARAALQGYDNARLPSEKSAVAALLPPENVAAIDRQVKEWQPVAAAPVTEIPPVAAP